MIELIHPDLRHLAIPIDELTEDPSNANAHDERNLVAIAESFKRFGQRKPVVMRRDGMVVEAGNGTLASLRAEGWTHLACIVCDDDEQTATAFALADNQSARLAIWNPFALRDRVDELVRGGYDVQGLGWSATEITDILAGKADTLQSQLGPGAEQDAPQAETRAATQDPDTSHDDDSEDIPDPPVEPTTQRGEVIQLGKHTLHCADCMDVLRSLPDNSVDAIVTDPPYGLSPDGRARTWDDIEALRREGKGPRAGFMGSAWDAGVPGITWARECLRVLKPGGHMIAHSATRTVHRLACAIEDAGFELRDTISWLHWQGFPKSLDVSKAIDAGAGAQREVVGTRKQRANSSASGVPMNNSAGEMEEITAPATDDAKRWNGWGTALKPVCEPAVLARKPLSESTVAANVLRWGTGAMNIDACRIAPGDPAWPGPVENWNVPNPSQDASFFPTASGRSGTGRGETRSTMHDLGRWPANIYACPKPASNEREAGTADLPQEKKVQLAGAIASDDPVRARFLSQPTGNVHPTVKPIKLYRWLLRLVTPTGGTVVEPFGGSGTTLVAAEREGFAVIAAEREPKYCDIIRARVLHALS